MVDSVHLAHDAVSLGNSDRDVLRYCNVIFGHRTVQFFLEIPTLEDDNNTSWRNVVSHYPDGILKLRRRENVKSLANWHACVPC
jgi:hypothetical protein